MNIRSVRTFLLLAFGVVCFLAFLRPISSNDFWWHVKTAEVFLRTGKGLFVDVFSHTAAGAPLPNHEWGAQLILYFATCVFGLTGVRLMAAGAGTAIILWQCFWGSRATLGALGFLAAGISAPFLVRWVEPRPALFSAVFGATLPFLLQWLRDGLTWRRVAIVFLLFCLWMNLHAEALIGILLAVLYLALVNVRSDEDSRRYSWKRLALVILVLSTAVFAQPFGWHLPVQMYRDALHSTMVVREWRPTVPALFLMREWSLIALLPILWFAGIATLWRNRRRIPASEAALWAVASVVSLLAIREIWWIVIPCGYVARWLTLFRWSRRRLTKLVLLAMVFWLAALPWQKMRFENWVADVEEGDFPVAQADFIERKGLKGDLFNFYDNGGYLIYRLYPRCRTFIDPRHYPFSQEVWNAHDEILYGGPRAQELLDRYHVDLLLIRSGYFADPERNPFWFRAFTDGHYDVYIRKNARNLENLKRVGVL
ncbi:MAG: hypothetical protein V1798_07330 [Pseudomonadota bacterium]